MKKCLLCGRENLSDFTAKNSLLLQRCRDCGLVFRKTLPGREELEKFYQKAAYYQFWGERKKENLRQVERIKKLTFGKTFDLLEKFVLKGKVLEIGCANGVLLEVAEKRGWQVSGVECFTEFAREAKKRVRGEIFSEMFEKIKFPENSFALAVFYDSLEHFDQPVQAIQKVYRLLKPKGFIAIVMPDVESLSEKIMGSSWTHYKEEHLFYFSGRTLKKMLAENGFQTVFSGNGLKALNIAYMSGQFESFPHWFLTPFFKILKFLPEFFLYRPFFLSTGEMMLIAEKK